MAGKSKTSSSSSKEVPVELGFLEEEENLYKLRSAFFPSKFGGSPSWLNLRDIPGPEDLLCPSQGCGGPLKFLLQVYAPMDTPSSFHRTIFVFVCPKCKKDNLVALRCQLEQENEFYSSEAPDEEDTGLGEVGPSTFGVKGCVVCGIKSKESCGGCKGPHYCGKEHQSWDWKVGCHKEQCGKEETQENGHSDIPIPSSSKATFGYKEHVLVIDTEVIPKAKSKGNKKSEKDQLLEFEKLMQEGKLGSLANDNSKETKDMLESASSQKSDKAFNKFKKRVDYHPDQVLRYDRGGTPLWVSSEGTLDPNDVPPCQYCKGKRTFEFQIMPQLLNYCGDDALIGALDWGTVAVYTCENHCEEGGVEGSPAPAYKKEFLWQQHFKGDEDDEEGPRRNRKCDDDDD